MSERFEEAVIAHCAPTLAGHKCGSLFSWRKTGGQDLAQELSSVNRLLQPKGVRVRLLKCCPAGALVYVYRPAMLHKRLERTDIADFLHGQGYASLKLSDALATLARHIHCGEEFPHEVGIFLDYPLAAALAAGRPIQTRSRRGAPLRCIASAAWFTWPATIIKDTVLRG